MRSGITQRSTIYHPKPRHIKNPSRNLLEGTRLACNFTPVSLCDCSHMTMAPICGEGNRRPEWCRQANFSLLDSLLQAVILLSVQTRTVTDPAHTIKPVTQTGFSSTSLFWWFLSCVYLIGCKVIGLTYMRWTVSQQRQKVHLIPPLSDIQTFLMTSIIK